MGARGEVCGGWGGAARAFSYQTQQEQVAPGPHTICCCCCRVVLAIAAWAACVCLPTSACRPRSHVLGAQQAGGHQRVQYGERLLAQACGGVAQAGGRRETSLQLDAAAREALCFPGQQRGERADRQLQGVRCARAGGLHSLCVMARGRHAAAPHATSRGAPDSDRIGACHQSGYASGAGSRAPLCVIRWCPWDDTSPVSNDSSATQPHAIVSTTSRENRLLPSGLDLPDGLPRVPGSSGEVPIVGLWQRSKIQRAMCRWSAA